MLACLRGCCSGSSCWSSADAVQAEVSNASTIEIREVSQGIIRREAPSIPIAVLPGDGIFR